MSRRVLATVGGAVVVVLLTAGGFWYFVLRADAPPPADLSALDQELAAESAENPNAPVLYESVLWPPIAFGFDEIDQDRICVLASTTVERRAT